MTEETNSKQQKPAPSVQALEAKAKTSTKKNLATMADKAIKSVQQQRLLSQEELNRVVTI